MIPPLWPCPLLCFHSSLPVRASYARNQPRGSGTNSKSPPVDSRLASGGSGNLISHFILPVIGSRPETWPCALSPCGCVMLKSAPMFNCAAGSRIGVVFLISRSMHHSLPTLYSRPVFGLYEPMFQLMPPAMNGHRFVCLPSVMSRRPTSSPFGLMSFTKLTFFTSFHTFCTLPSRSYTHTKPLLLGCTVYFLPSRSSITNSPVALSKSHASCGSSWWKPFSLPVSGSSKTTDVV